MQDNQVDLSVVVDIAKEFRVSEEHSSRYKEMLENLDPATLNQHSLTLDLIYDRLRRQALELADIGNKPFKVEEKNCQQSVITMLYTIKKMRKIALAVDRQKCLYFYSLRHFKKLVKEVLPTETYVDLIREANSLAENHPIDTKQSYFTH